jgi:hypothetical protein
LIFFGFSQRGKPPQKETKDDRISSFSFPAVRERGRERERERYAADGSSTCSPKCIIVNVCFHLL